MEVNRTFLITFFLLAASCANAFAQLALRENPQPMSPQASEMTRYGTHNVNLYTGRIGVNIPIGVYKDADFEVPVSLSYNYNGFRVNEQPSEAGLGWSVSCGGVITREVRGLPDEERGSLKIYASGEERECFTNGLSYSQEWSMAIYPRAIQKIIQENNLQQTLNGKPFFIYLLNKVWVLSYIDEDKYIVIKKGGENPEDMLSESDDNIYYLEFPLEDIGLTELFSLNKESRLKVLEKDPIGCCFCWLFCFDNYHNLTFKYWGGERVDLPYEGFCRLWEILFPSLSSK